MINTVALVSLSAGTIGEDFVKHEVNIGLKRLEQFGLNVKIMPHAMKGIEYVKNHPKERANDLLAAICDEEVDMILCAIGGDDTYRLLPYLFKNNELKEAIEKGVVIITGGPGTGKTTTINTIIKVFENNDQKVVLAAPTGRAAKRMSETSNKEAKTIHRLLEMGFGMDSDELTFMKNEEDPIDADVVILDEVSMVDIVLMYSLLRAIKSGTRLLIVGDSDQLPSVGAGNVLKDLIDSEVINTVRLNEIFRQAQESMIVVNAHKINKGEPLKLNVKGKDFFFIKKEGDDILQEIVGVVSERLPKFYGVDKLKDIQVLSPMRKGTLGVNNLNIELQKSLNPPSKYKTEEVFSKRTFRVGDKVMQIKNNYTRKWQSEDGSNSGHGIYNGDIGYIYYIDNI